MAGYTKHNFWTEVAVAVLIWLVGEFGDNVLVMIVSLLEGASHGSY